MENMTMTIATRTRADVAWMACAVRPLLSDTGVRVQGTGVSTATAPTQPTAMDVVYSEPGRPPI